MRLDHLLSKERTSRGKCVLLFRYQEIVNKLLVHLGTGVPRSRQSHLYRRQKAERKEDFPASFSSACALATEYRNFWWRCGQGKHPFPSRTRRLRPDRPMVLHWRRCGRVGGCQIRSADGTALETVWESRWLPDPNGDVAQLGEHLPCKQGVESSNLFISTVFRKGDKETGQAEGL